MNRQRICGCGHSVVDHDDDRCRKVRYYPDVLNARPCGCKGVWKPDPAHSGYKQWVAVERRAGGVVKP